MISPRIRRMDVVAAAGVIAALVTLLTPRYTRAEEDDPAIRRVIDDVGPIWERWSDIKSAKISGFAFAGGDRSKSELTREIILNMVAQLSALTDPAIDDLWRITNPLFPGDGRRLDETRPLGGWRPFQFVQDGDSRRYDTTPVEGGASSRVRTSTGEQDQFGRQANIYAGQSGFQMEQLKDFLFFPPIARYRVSWKTAARHSTDMADLVARSLMDDKPVCAVTFHRNHGFVEHYAHHSQSGFLVSEVFQSAPLLTPANVPVARLRVNVLYAFPSQSAHIVVAHLIRSLELNAPIDPAAFELAVPAGTTVVKVGEKPFPDRSTPAIVIREPVENLRTLSNDPRFPMAEKARIVQQEQQHRIASLSPTPGISRFVWIVGFNAGVLGLVAYFVRRRRTPR